MDLRVEGACELPHDPSAKPRGGCEDRRRDGGVLQVSGRFVFRFNRWRSPREAAFTGQRLSGRREARGAMAAPATQGSRHNKMRRVVRPASLGWQRSCLGHGTRYWAPAGSGTVWHRPGVRDERAGGMRSRTFCCQKQTAYAPAERGMKGNPRAIGQTRLISDGMEAYSRGVAHLDTPPTPPVFPPRGGAVDSALSLSGKDFQGGSGNGMLLRALVSGHDSESTAGG